MTRSRPRFPVALAAFLVVLGAQSLVPHPARAQTDGSAPGVSWWPERPAQGTLFLLRVSAGSDAALSQVTGVAGGEELHFTEVNVVEVTNTLRLHAWPGNGAAGPSWPGIRPRHGRSRARPARRPACGPSTASPFPGRTG